MSNQETPCRDSFVFYRSFYESIKRLPERAQNALFRAVAEYGLDQVVPDFAGIPQQPFVEAIFAGIRPQLDANHKRFLNGCKGGAPVGNRNNPNGRKGGTNQEPTKNQPNDNVNVNENENGNVEGDGGNGALTLPFPDNPEFVETWNELMATTKWKHKTVRALKMALTQLAKYDVRFSIILMQTAISGNYQGVVFTDTPTRYEQWKRSQPQYPETSPGEIVTNVEFVYKSE